MNVVCFKHGRVACALDDPGLRCTAHLDAAAAHFHSFAQKLVPLQLGQDFCNDNLHFARQFRCFTRQFLISNKNLTMTTMS